MRNVLALIGALVVGVGGVGWYLGWYKLDVTKAPDGKPQITTTIDTQKAASDAEGGAKQFGAFVADHAKKAADDAKQPVTPATTPGPTTPQPVSTPQDGGIFGPNYAVTPPEAKKGVTLIAPK
jgi:hypothetical protein